MSSREGDDLGGGQRAHPTIVRSSDCFDIADDLIKKVHMSVLAHVMPTRMRDAAKVRLDDAGGPVR